MAEIERLGPISTPCILATRPGSQFFECVWEPIELGTNGAKLHFFALENKLLIALWRAQIYDVHTSVVVPTRFFCSFLYISSNLKI